MSGSIALSVGLTCGVFAACAGEQIPEIDDQLAGSIEAAYYGDATIGASASAGAGGAPPSAGGRGNAGGGAAGRQGAGSPNAGASGAGEVGGAAGSGMAGNAGADSSAGGAAGSGATGASNTCDGFTILAANCGTSGCHGEGSNLGTFAASEEDARSYVGRPGAICTDSGSVIDPRDPPASLMIEKLSDFPPCGQPMPANGTLLADADIACLEDWIGGLD